MRGWRQWVVLIGASLAFTLLLNFIYYLGYYEGMNK